MAEEERDPEKRMRVAGIVKDLQAATSEQPFSEVQTAFANTISIMCLSMGTEVADELFISTQSALSEVYLTMRNRVRQGKEPGVVN